MSKTSQRKAAYRKEHARLYELGVAYGKGEINDSSIAAVMATPYAWRKFKLGVKHGKASKYKLGISWYARLRNFISSLFYRRGRRNGKGKS